ncbi:transglycosylase domain-containing protein [Plantactinospora sp. S1510]|uniref:Transglycosylase domain-containing protein n=1 Tax=Plantactinospora alkalitolerans TaxID=2789879 RepID=A0ABS0GNQ0_9ACTN|nr:transglycosylase domain-containing protein [Plantactinospora alkalitolerans]MBF9127726.1 transglycosylase domain-containing protein [Plantactinospora alkalitolerans]
MFYSPLSYLEKVTNPTRPSSGRIVHLLRAGLIAGVVVAAAAFPLVAIGGLAAKAGADMVDKTPADLLASAPAQTSYVYAADGTTLITTFYEEHRRYVPLVQMSPYIQQAIVASEDSRFYEHNGVDPKGVVRAFVANQQAGGVSQGASTLTMQYVRMALRDSAKTPLEIQQATEQTPLRKLREMRLALDLEKESSKALILERYLNSAYFGHRAYGIYSASEIFFSKLPKDLTPVEAATLAGLVKAPTAYDPASSDRKAATDRRNYVLDRMHAMGYLSPQATATAMAEPIQLRLSNPPNDCMSVPEEQNSWGFFCDYLKAWWSAQPAFGANPLERLDKLRRGGYTIITSLDPKIHEAAERRVMTEESAGSPFAHGLVAVEPGTGYVRSMAVNRVYSLDQSENGAHSDPSRRGQMKGNYPNTVVPLLGGGDLPGYQAGSTFKMFTMVAALDAGLGLGTAFDSPHRIVSIYPDGSGGPTDCGGFWCPSNASGAMSGRQTMWSGFGKSVNTYFVWLEQQVGAENVVRLAERLGLQWRTDIDKRQASPSQANKWGSFTLGVSDVTPLEMANAYATIAADGRFCEALPVVSITSPDGTPATYRSGSGMDLVIAQPRCNQEIDPDAARAATDAARCPTGDTPARGSCGGWSTADRVRGIVGRPVAGKTGTTDSDRAAWFVAYTPELAVASFLSDPDSPMNPVGSGQANKPIDAVAGFLKDALKDQPVRQFNPPSAEISA